MFTLSATLFACITLVLATPLTLKEVEELKELDPLRRIKVTIIRDDFDEEPFTTELIPELDLEEESSINSGSKLSINETVTEALTFENVTANDATIEEVHANLTKEDHQLKNDTEIILLKEVARTKRQTEQLDLDDIETIVTVKNNRIGTEKKFFFKDMYKAVKGQRYKCKIGLKKDSTVFYHRCIWIGTSTAPEVIQNDDAEFFNIV